VIKVLYDAIGTLTAVLTKESNIAFVDSTLYGVLFAAIGIGDWTYLTIDDGNKAEVVKVYRVNSAGVFLVRGQDNTTPTLFSAGTSIKYQLTAAEIKDRIIPPSIQVTAQDAIQIENGKIGYLLAAIQDEGGTFSTVSENEIRLGRNEQAYGCCISNAPGSVGPPTISIKIHGVPPDGEVGEPYSFTWTVTGGTGTGNVFSKDSGSIPTGTIFVTIEWLNDTDSGIPTVAGVYTFVLRVTDDAGNTDSAPESITIRNALYGYVSNVAAGSVSLISRAFGVVDTVTPIVNPGPIGVLPNRKFAYVCAGSGNVQVINAITHLIDFTVPVGAPTPTGLAVKHDGIRVYASTGSDNTVVQIDTTLPIPAVVGSPWTGFLSPSIIVMHPVLDRMYIVDTLNNRIQCRATDGTILGNIPVFDPQGLGISPDGNTLYVGVYGGMNAYSTITYGPIGSVGYRSGFGPNNVATNAVGTKAYVSDYNYPDVPVIDLSSFSVIKFIPTGVPSFDIKRHPDTGNIYVPAGLVHVIDTVTDTVIRNFPTSSGPAWIAFPE
jgi:DNA-binding beta-propeller fold protein YncE